MWKWVSFMLINQGLGTKMSMLIKNNIKLLIIHEEGHHRLLADLPINGCIPCIRCSPFHATCPLSCVGFALYTPCCHFCSLYDFCSLLSFPLHIAQYIVILTECWYCQLHLWAKGCKIFSFIVVPCILITSKFLFTNKCTFY